jgi:hypothetical protein
MGSHALALLAVLLLAGCAAPIGRDGEPIGLGQALCESIPATRCCRQHKPPPPQPFCTRTLGQADCWTNPAMLADHPPGLADDPAAPPSACS